MSLGPLKCVVEVSRETSRELLECGHIVKACGTAKRRRCYKCQRELNGGLPWQRFGSLGEERAWRESPEATEDYA